MHEMPLLFLTNQRILTFETPFAKPATANNTKHTTVPFWNQFELFVK